MAVGGQCMRNVEERVDGRGVVYTAVHTADGVAPTTRPLVYTRRRVVEVNEGSILVMYGHHLGLAYETSTQHSTGEPREVYVPL